MIPESVLGAWAEAFNSGNTEALLATYATDAQLLPPNAAKSVGHDGVLAIFGEGMKQRLKATQATETLEVRGDLAFRSGTYTLMDSAGAPIDHGKFAEVWRKGPDGGWKMSHDMWNSSKPVAPPSTALTAPAPQ